MGMMWICLIVEVDQVSIQHHSVWWRYIFQVMYPPQPQKNIHQDGVKFVKKNGILKSTRFQRARCDVGLCRAPCFE